jgi:preprotein translocase subunit SecY
VFITEFLVAQFSVPFYFGGTSLMIMVVVIMDFQAQVAHLMSHQYEGLMKRPTCAAMASRNSRE